MSSDITELIESQERRIKELEAALHIAKHNEQCTHNANVNLCKEIAALRQRIADAPIFGYTFSKHDNFGRVVWDVDHAVHPDAIEYRSLISKEDLL